MSLYKLLFPFLLLPFAACGPKVTKVADLSSTKLQTIAILPTLTQSEVRRERVQYLTNALRRDLEARGFILLDSRLVESSCVNSDCSKLFERYDVDSLIQLDITSDREANFLAGYYNTLSGTLTLSGKSGGTLVKIEHTESEKGGLLFNSGQVIEGIRSTINNFGEEKFATFADKFIKNVVQQLPQRPAVAMSVTRPIIEEVRVIPSREYLYDIQVKGTPHSRASLLLGTQRASLRELSPGQYRNILPLGILVKDNTPIKAELRSPFGATSIKDVAATNILPLTLSTPN